MWKFISWLLTLALLTALILMGVPWWGAALIYIVGITIWRFIRRGVAKRRYAPMVEEYEKDFRNILNWDFVGRSDIGQIYVEPLSVIRAGNIAGHPLIEPDIKENHIIAKVGVVLSQTWAELNSSRATYAVHMCYMDFINNTVRSSGIVFGAADYTFIAANKSDLQWRKIELGSIDGAIQAYVVDCLGEANQELKKLLSITTED